MKHKYISLFYLIIGSIGLQILGINGSRPEPSSWSNNNDNKNLDDRNDLFLRWLIHGTCANDEPCRPKPYNHVEYEGFDGWYNSFARPSQGAVDTPLLRLIPPVYEDGVYEPVDRRYANPIDVSRRLMNGSNGMFSKVGNTAFLVFFGQQVVEEVLDSQGAGCPPEYFNIPIPKDHEFFTKSPKVAEMPFLRTRYDFNTGYSPNNPRQQLNEITPYIDGGLIYGSSKGWADALRTFPDGTLAQDGQLAWDTETNNRGFPSKNTQRLPFANPAPPSNHSIFVDRQFTANVDRFFKIGNPRGNENPFLLTFGIFWYRWHNAIARFLKREYPDWEGERIFNEARKWVIATQQSVYMYDWLPKYIKTSLPKYDSKRGYNPSTDPQVSHMFQTSAMRFGHTLVPSGVYLRKTAAEGCDSIPHALVEGKGHKSHGVRTCNSFWRSPELFKDPKNFERFLLGLSSQSSEREDNFIVEDLRGRVFGPLEFNRRDLMAVNIQRGRDHGLPSYAKAREYFGLPSFTNLNPSTYKSNTNSATEDKYLLELQKLYNNTPDNVDVWPGGILETNRGPGPLFQAIIKDQFERIRAGDRFWFENSRNGLFSKEERERIQSIKIIDILLNVADVSLDDIQLDPFTAPRLKINFPKGESCKTVLHTNTDCTLFDVTNNNFSAKVTCYYLPLLNNDNLETCTTPQTYDHFSGSSTAFILTFFFVGLFCLGLLVLTHLGTIFVAKKKVRKTYKTLKVNISDIICKERVSTLERRVVALNLDKSWQKILVKNINGKTLRVIDLYYLDGAKLRRTTDCTRMLLSTENHYDLVLLMEDSYSGQQLRENLMSFFKETNKSLVESVESFFQLKKNVITVKDRERELAKFTRFVLDNTFKTKLTGHLLADMSNSEESQQNKFLAMQLTQSELANSLGMTPDSIFVRQLFYLMDKNESGFISIKEFLAFMTSISKGSVEERARIFFNIYDLDNSGNISIEDFQQLVKSTGGTELKDEDASKIISNMLESVGLDAGDSLTFKEYLQVFKADECFSNITLDIPKAVNDGHQAVKRGFSLYGSLGPKSILSTKKGKGKGKAGGKRTEKEGQQRHTIQQNDDLGLDETDRELEVAESKIQSLLRQTANYIRRKGQIIFWRSLYTLVLLLIFAERAYYFSVEREHAGLRQIAGYGVTVTRGAASAMMFTFSSLLVTMCRNIFSILRDTAVHRIFPFDDMVEMHKYIGWWALFFTLMHIIGHAINFYHIATQTPADVACIFRNFFRSTHVLPTFQYWCWETITGLTGILLTLQMAVIYIFAVSARQNIFRLFWLTHNTYPLFYFLMILHGSGMLVQTPIFHLFFLGPCVLFIIDKLLGLPQNAIQIDVMRAVHLPSNVILLCIRRPPNFNFLSGQWIRIASLGINSQEYHPFTISSSPDERHLTLHIRGVGPWTKRLREVYPDYTSIQNDRDFAYKKLCMNGPFGEGHQNWWDYEVVVLVGGGIGVTPFASILKDIAYKCSQPTVRFKCKRVIFLWVTQSQRQFEWMTDILNKVEQDDKKGIIRVHIFITQFKNKFDLRTIMLYMAERHFQKLHGKSLFTGLKAITHFSRPDFPSVFRSIKNLYGTFSDSDLIKFFGVFTCGSPSLSSSVERGCQTINKEPGPILKHYYENF